MQHSELRKLLLNSNLEELIKDNYNTYQVQQRLVSSLKPDFKFHYNPIINFAKKTLGYTWDSSEKRWIYNENNIEKVEDTKPKKPTKNNKKSDIISTIHEVILGEDPIEEDTLLDTPKVFEKEKESPSKFTLIGEQKDYKNNTKRHRKDVDKEENEFPSLNVLENLCVTEFSSAMLYCDNIKLSISINELILKAVSKEVRRKSNKELSQSKIIEIALIEFLRLSHLLDI